MATDRGGSVKQMKSIRRVFEIIDLLWQLDGGTPTNVANQLDIPLSTAHDYLQSLESTEYVTKEAGVYQLGYSFLSMGSRLQRRNRLFQVTQEELRLLAEETREVANVSVMEDDHWILLNSESGPRGLNLGTYPGLKTSLHTHAAGKVILANLPADRRESIITRGLERRTEHTITDPDELRARLETIRGQEYAVDKDEQVVGMGVVATPLISNGVVLGAIAVVCPSGRLDDADHQEYLVQKLREATDSILVNYQYS